MSNFDLSNYKEVKDRITEFYLEFPDGTIKTFLRKDSDGEFIFEARVYRSPEEVVQDVYTSGWAREIEGVGYINKTSALENCECVPLTVPALTRNGWRYHHQLQVGDEVLAYDVEKDALVWDEILKLSVFPDQPLVRIGNNHFLADCTPNHRWVINRELRPWDEWEAGTKRDSTRDTMLIASRFEPRTWDHQNDAARLGWLFGDGTIEYEAPGLVSGAVISPSEEESFEGLTLLFGEPHQEVEEGHDSLRTGTLVWRVSASEVRRVLGQFGVNGPEDLALAVLDMTSEEADAFLDSMMRSGGYRGTYKEICKHRLAAVQLAMFITGHPTTPIVEHAEQGFATELHYTVSMHTAPRKSLSQFQVEKLPPQDVWCPTTRTGTWVGLFHGRPAITGNTSAVGRALANLDYGVDARRPSREEMQAVLKQQADHNAVQKYITEVAQTIEDDLEIDFGNGMENAKQALRGMWEELTKNYKTAVATAKILQQATGIKMEEE